MKLMCSGRVAVVTGASNGIGRSTALTLAREGAKVVVNYNSDVESATRIVTHIEKAGGEALAIQANVFEAEDCQRLIQSSIEHFGEVNICVITPGGGWHPEAPDALDSAGVLDDLHRETAPVLHLLPLLLSHMAQQQWGRIITVGMNPQLRSPAYAYNLAKFARHEALLSAQGNAWSHGVTLNVVAPSPVSEISSLEEAIEQSLQGDAWQNRSTTSPQDIAESIAYLCSEAGRFITGAVVPFNFSG